MGFYSIVVGEGLKTRQSQRLNLELGLKSITGAQKPGTGNKPATQIEQQNLVLHHPRAISMFPPLNPA